MYIHIHLSSHPVYIKAYKKSLEQSEIARSFVNITKPYWLSEENGVNYTCPANWHTFRQNEVCKAQMF